MLSHLIEHHVNEEEMRGGMFAKARAADMELEELGLQMSERKAELEGQAGPDKKGLLGVFLGTDR